MLSPQQNANDADYRLGRVACELATFLLINQHNVRLKLRSEADGFGFTGMQLAQEHFQQVRITRNGRLDPLVAHGGLYKGQRNWIGMSGEFPHYSLRDQYL
jgi:hypothetical protein